MALVVNLIEGTPSVWTWTSEGTVYLEELLPPWAPWANVAYGAAQWASHCLWLKLLLLGRDLLEGQKAEEPLWTFGTGFQRPKRNALMWACFQV